jgi:uracil phosphoribosyltransferase
MGASESTEEAASMQEESDVASSLPLETCVDATQYNPLTVVSTSKALPGLVTKMRDVTTSNTDFVKYSKRVMTLLAEEALAEFPSKMITIQTPCGPCEGVQTVDLSSVCAVSIVRSGDALVEVVRSIVPEVSVGKILIQRDESHPDKVPKLFYSKMPKTCTHVLLCDPMLATGGSAIMALDVLTVKYRIPPKNIIFANVICCPEGLEALAQAYPRVKIVTAVVDSHLNDEKYIVPGLGDYGDRFFGTT